MRRPGAMIEPRRAVPAAVLVLAMVAITAGCTHGAQRATSSSAAPAASAVPTGAASATADGSPGAGILDPATPTACLTLGTQDCVRARGLATTVLDADDPAPIYVQVGPFGCATDDPCPTTLVTRPEGDVVIEFPAGTGINVHLLVAPDGSFTATRGDAMGVAVEPSSISPVPAGPIEYALGHCGIFSGIDVDGDWWDPVGPVLMDSGDAVNATPGVLTITDPAHAMFVTPGGFSVQLQRHAGAKLLPLCM